MLELTGIADIADRRTQKLSGGQTQRVRFALALVSNPELLVLDEPTVAMDVEGRHAFWATMRGFAARGKTVVFATHYLEEADAYADRVVLMAHGRVVADGPTTEIKAHGRHAHDPGDAAGRDARRARARCPASTRPTAAARPSCSTCDDSDARHPRAARALPAARDIEIAGAGLEEAFLQLTSDAADERRGGARMSTATYMRFELLRTFRNRRFFIFSLVFPLVLYFLIAGPEPQRARLRRHRDLGAALLHGRPDRVRDHDRDARQRRPHRRPSASVGLEPPAAPHPAHAARYFRAKVVTGYLMAGLTIIVLYIAGGATLGVWLPVGRWMAMTGLILVALIPFAALGIAIGHLLTADSIGPALGGSVGLLAFLGGIWFPITSGFCTASRRCCRPTGWCRPATSPWAGRCGVHRLAGRGGLDGRPRGAFAIWAYQRDTKRV